MKMTAGRITKLFGRCWKWSSPLKSNKKQQSPATEIMSNVSNTLPDNSSGILKPTKLARPMDRSNMGHEVAALNATLALLNNPALTGAEVPAEEKANTRVAPADRHGATLRTSDPIMEIPNKPVVVVAHSSQPVPSAPIIPPDLRRVFYTGRLCVGKDYIAAATGAKLFGYADPLYYLCKKFFNLDVTSTEGKDKPGIRATLQAFGQWGRGEVNEQYPLTPARACFVTMIHSLAAAGALDESFGVDWASYGRNQNIWLDAGLMRVESYIAGGGSNVAITNVRFENEYHALRKAGWVHFHVMCSPAAWKDRLAKRGLTTDSPTLKDMSEKLAAGMDRDVVNKVSASKQGVRLHVIWNDSAPAPSQRLYTFNQFLQEFVITHPAEKNNNSAPIIGVNTGE
jgi:hypothetical protein